MAVAYFMAHFPKGLESLPWGLLPINNNGEPAAHLLLRLPVHRRQGLGHLERRRGAGRELGPRRSLGLEGDPHLLHPVDEVRAQAARRSQQPRVPEARHQLLEDHVQLEAREAGAEAEVLADAEGEVLVVGAADVEAIRVGEDAPRRGWPTGTRSRPSDPCGSAGPGARRPPWPCAGSSAPPGSKRRISSTATGMREGSRASSASCSGCSSSSLKPFVVTVRVVSLPATQSSRKNEAYSSSERFSPSTSPRSRLVVKFVRGLRLEALRQLHRVARTAPPRPACASASSPPSSGSSKPTMRVAEVEDQLAGPRAARPSARRSPGAEARRPAPRRTPPRPAARRRRRCAGRARGCGAPAAATMRRREAALHDAAELDVLGRVHVQHQHAQAGAARPRATSWMLVPPSHDEKSWGLRETKRRSSYRVTHQKPGPSGSGVPVHRVLRAQGLEPVVGRARDEGVRVGEVDLGEVHGPSGAGRRLGRL